MMQFAAPSYRDTRGFTFVRNEWRLRGELGPRTIGLCPAIWRRSNAYSGQLRKIESWLAAIPKSRMADLGTFSSSPKQANACGDIDRRRRKAIKQYAYSVAIEAAQLLSD